MSQPRETTQRVAAMPEETWGDDCVLCPWCGHEQTDDLYEYDDGDEYTCPKCEGASALALYTTIHYTARPKTAPEAP